MTERRPLKPGHVQPYRWPPFEPGNRASVKHGCYSELEIAPRAQELREQIVAQMSVDDADRFGLLVSTAAALGAQTERALLVMNDPDDPVTSERLQRSARAWAKLWLQSLSQLGLTPQSAREAHRDAGVKRLAEHLEAVYADEAGEGDADA